jgi:hypothetical protein
MTRPIHPGPKPAIREDAVRHVRSTLGPPKPAVRASARPVVHLSPARRVDIVDGRPGPSALEDDGAPA